VNRKILSLLFSLFIFIPFLFSQNNKIYFNNDFDGELDKQIYSVFSSIHTSIKPFSLPEISQVFNYDSLLKSKRINKTYKSKFKQKLWNKIFNEHLFILNKKAFKLTIDPLINFEFGSDLNSSNSTYVNTRGVQVLGAIGNKFSFYTNFHENQATFIEYIDNFISQTRVVPGQGLKRNFKTDGYDYAMASGYISYTPSKYFNFQFGHGKNFFGDGYRSLLLSDNSFNYPYLKITTSVWHFKYVNLYAQFQDIGLPHSNELGFQKKYGTFHYLSWKATKRLNISFFEAIIWEASDSTGTRGFDINYLNPVIFFRPVEFSIGSPDNALMGLNVSYKIAKTNVLYGQLLLDEFKFSEVTGGNGWWGNKQAFQLGFKSYDIFKISNLFFQTEYNFVRPYTYSHRAVIQNYGHYNQPLAHPYGANFWESVSFLKYNFGRFYFQYKFLYSIIGEDEDGKNYGKDIYKSYNSAENEYNNFVGQGLKTTLVYNDFRASYLINPSYNLNFTIGLTDRTLSNSAENSHSTYIYFTLRTSIDNFYYDF